MTSLIVTETGRLELDTPIKLTTIALKSATLYLHTYNLTEPTTYIKTDSSTIKIPPGYYTYDQLVQLMPEGEFSVDVNTLKVTYKGIISGGLAGMIKNECLYLTPLSLYLRVDCIDSSKNLLNGKRSDILSAIPVGKTNLSEIIEYQPQHYFKSANAGVINSLKISIQDEWGNEYLGKCVIELLLQ